MTSLPNNPNLELLLPANKRWAFYVHDFTLTEGISQIPVGVLNAYSPDFMDMETLNEYLDIQATVKITQLHNNEKISRCFSGIITKVKHLGLLQETETKTVYGFRITIQPPLVDLNFARHNYSFKDRTPREAIIDLLDGHIYNMDQLNEGNTPDLNTPSSFYQTKENDLQFLLRILETYGINFCYHHPFTEDEPKAPILFLNSAGVFSIAGELSPTTDLSKPLQFHCRTRDEENFAMTQWTLERKIGVDAVKVDFQSPNDQTISHLSGDSNAPRLVCFNSSPFGLIHPDDVEQKINSFRGKMLLTGHNWQGATESLQAMPGVPLDVLEFYGKKNNTSIPAMILYAELFCRAPMPDSLLQSTDPQPAVCEIKIGCIDRAMPANLKASITEVQQEHTNHSTVIAGTCAQVDTSSSSSTALYSSGSTRLLQAVVCDAAGNTSAQNSFSNLSENKLKDNRYTFTAKLLSGSNCSTPVDVWLVMPLGGFGQGLFRVPRQGEYILVAQNAGSNEYYLMGYLPNGNMPFASKANYSTEIDPDTQETHTLSSATILRFSHTSAISKSPDYLGDDASILPKRVCMSSGGDPQYSEIGFYTSYTLSSDGGNTKTSDTPSSDGGNTKTSDPLSCPPTTSNNALLDNGDTTPMVNDGGNTKTSDTLSCPPTTSNNALLDKGNTKTVTENLNIQAPNTVSMVAGNSININSPSITFSGQKNGNCKKSSLSIACFNKVNINAETEILLSVGKCSILITQDSIALTAARWSAIPGPFTSSIILTAMSGVIVSGMNTMISGAYGLTLSDGSGDSIKMGTGIMTESAVAITEVTQDIFSYGIQNSITGAFAAAEIGGFIAAAAGCTEHKKYKSVAQYVYHGTNIVSTIYSWYQSGKHFERAADAFKNLLDNEAGIHTKRLHIARLICNAIAAIIEQITAIINEINPEWFTKKYGPVGFTWRDAFRLTSMSLYTIGWTTGVIAGLRLARPGTATLELQGNIKKGQAIVYEKLSVTSEVANSPIPI